MTRLILSLGFSLPQLEDKLLLQTNQYLCGDPHVNRVDFIQTTNVERPANCDRRAVADVGIPQPAGVY